VSHRAGSNVTLLDLAGRRLVLASASPRRSELLRSVGLDFDVMPADIDESVRPGEAPSDYVARLSREKAAAVGERLDGAAVVVVAADTTVDVDGRILEKPLDDGDARRMLQLLSGRTHLVHTGVTTLSFGVGSGRTGSAMTVVVETAVRFVELTDRAIDWYLSTGEHVGKAGAYGIQGAAAALVERVDGSVTNVIGLPLAETVVMLGSNRNSE
jgi:septum formation protein